MILMNTYKLLSLSKYKIFSLRIYFDEFHMKKSIDFILILFE